MAGPSLSAEEQYVSDVLNYIDHGDPQVRGATAILCGTLVCSVLGRCRFHVAGWMGAVRARTGNHQLSAFSVVAPGWPSRVQVHTKASVLALPGRKYIFSGGLHSPAAENFEGRILGYLQVGLCCCEGEHEGCDIISLISGNFTNVNNDKLSLILNISFRNSN